MKKKLFRVLAAALAVVMLAGCTHFASFGEAEPEEPQPELPEVPQQEEPVEPSVLRVAYEEGESLNPYNTQSLQNYYIAQLLYDPLFRLDEDYNPQNCLAQSLSMAVDQVVQDDYVYEAAVVTVRLKPNILFWDGSELTAADVVYSLQKARESSYFSAGLTHVSWVEADSADPLQLTIHLTRPDYFFRNSLTFPVVKNGTGDSSCPVGCGRFEPAEENTFVPNTRHQRAVKNISAVELVEINDVSSIGYSIKTGLVDFACSDLRTPWNRSLGNGFTSVQMSNMVYLGVNKAASAMADAELRQIVYRLINRSSIDSGVYLGQDIASWMPFNPAAGVIGNSAVALPNQLNASAAGEMLDQSGYAQRDKSGYRTRAGGYLSLTLVVNSENSERVAIAKAVAQTLEEVGLRTTVVECSFEEYKYRLSENMYDLFVGEVRLPLNMNILPMVTGANETGYGAYGSEALQNAVRNFLRTGNDYDKTVRLFAQEVPFIPLFFRQGIVAYPINFCSNIIATEQDIFYNIEDWVLL
ncbi:MAG: hypothetical protein IKU72_04330 [Oscillospiraceae bacterium]|nr:hypothetical protein [Oscillospiraceae bacterium]